MSSATVYECRIPGEPVAKGRPRFTNGGRTYTPRATQEAEERIAWELKAVCPQPDSDARFSVSAIFTTKKRGDVDNLLKLILDAGNGVVWGDDSQIDQIAAVRVREGEPMTVIRWSVL